MINLNKKDPIADAVKEILQQEALKGNQHKIDKNHNNKIDGEDFKILRGEKKEVKKEEVEQIDEISSGLATSYLNKRTAQHKPNLNSPETSNRDAKVAKGISSASRREHGFGPDKSAANKVTGRFEYRKNVGATHTFNKEEVEQIDELSKGTLGSYVKGAARDMAASRGLAKDFERDAKSAKKPNTKDINTRLSNKFMNHASKRNAGIGKAVERLTKEENEETKVMSKSLKQFKEGWDDMLKAVKERNKPQPNGGSGVKQGSRYGGSKQKDEPEKDTDEKK